MRAKTVMMCRLNVGILCPESGIRYVYVNVNVTGQITSKINNNYCKHADPLLKYTEFYQRQTKISSN